MPTLNLSAPRAKVGPPPYRSFQRILDSGIGEAYAIAENQFNLLSSGSGVALVSNDEKRRAEGMLVELVLVGRTKSGMRRYDVHIKNLKEVDYKPEHFMRWGVSVT
jgi:hypothetical protein